MLTEVHCYGSGGSVGSGGSMAVKEREKKENVNNVNMKNYSLRVHINYSKNIKLYLLL